MKRSRPPRQSFADQVVAATGLAGMLAIGAVRRCCTRAGIDVRRMGRRDLERMLPQLEMVLLVYLSSFDADIAVGRLRRLTEPRTPGTAASGSQL